jgi:hypothetical protein
MASPRMTGSSIRQRREHKAPDWDKYEFRRETVPNRHPNGTAVSYSTEGAEHYAPLRGGIGCVSQTGYPRRQHDFDGDGRCLWCNTLHPDYWPEVRG